MLTKTFSASGISLFESNNWLGSEVFANWMVNKKIELIKTVLFIFKDGCHLPSLIFI